MMLGALPADEFEGLLQGLQDDDWARKAEALREVAALLAGDEVDQGIELRLGPLVVGAASDRKWEVRKAAALALAELRHFDREVQKRALAALAEDSNHWVSQAATRASRRLRARDSRAKDWTLSENPKDPTLQLIMARIRQIGLGSMTPARIYDLATEVGEGFYRELAADTAHEVRTLLTPLQGYLVELQRHLDDRGTKDATAEYHLAKALARLQHLETVVEDLREYSSPSEAHLAQVDLESIIQEALAIGSERAARQAASAQLQVDVPKGIVIEALPDRLVRAMANLVANAYQAMPSGGTLAVRARAIGPGRVEVTLIDTGRGMTADQVEQAMKRYRTTRRDQGGTGLGLPIAERIIVQDHGGELTIESVPGEGTKVVIVLPLRREVHGG